MRQRQESGDCVAWASESVWGQLGIFKDLSPENNLKEVIIALFFFSCIFSTRCMGCQKSTLYMGLRENIGLWRKYFPPFSFSFFLFSFFWDRVLLCSQNWPWDLQFSYLILLRLSGGLIGVSYHAQLRKSRKEGKCLETKVTLHLHKRNIYI